MWTPCCQLASAKVPVPFHFSVFFAEPSQIFRLPRTEIPRASLGRKGCIKGCQVVHRISGKGQRLDLVYCGARKGAKHRHSSRKTCSVLCSVLRTSWRDGQNSAVTSRCCRRPGSQWAPSALTPFYIYVTSECIRLAKRSISACVVAAKEYGKYGVWS